METPNTHKTANAGALDIDTETVAQNDKSSTQKAANPPSQVSINEGVYAEGSADANHDPISLVFNKLLFDMEANIQASPGQIIADGSIYRFDVDKHGDNKGWYVCHYTDEASYAFYGSWSEGKTYHWPSFKGSTITSLQSEELKARMLEAKNMRNEVRALEQCEAAKKCKELWNALARATDDHPYLKNKGVKSYGIRLHPDNNNLVIPLFNRGDISSLQSINVLGNKEFYPNAKMSGGCHLIGDIGPLALICEGYATGASLYEATGYPTVVAFNAGNLLKVANELKKEHPDTDFIICADNDKWTPGNPGRTKAKEAANKISGLVVYPKFKKSVIAAHGKLTDWNDYHKLYGLSAVRKSLQPKIKKAMRNRSLFSDVTDLTRNITAPNYLVDGLIEFDTIGAFIGASSVGKSFVAISLTASVATGTPFAGKDVQQGAVLYLAGEGMNGISRRFAGWMQHTGTQIPKDSIHVSHKTISMDARGVSVLLDATEDMDQDIKLVVVDTLARHMAGEENSNRDMSAFIAAVDTIREEHGCALLIIHHTGHSTDKSNRARGASAFYAALDFEFLLKDDKKGYGTFEGTKNKEGVLYPKRSFNLMPIELIGIMPVNGDPVTTAVVRWGDFVPEASPSDTDNGSRSAYQSLKSALGSKGDYSQITLADWREYAYQKSTCSGNDSKRSEFYRFKKKLLKDGIIEVDGECCRVLATELIELGALKET